MRYPMTSEKPAVGGAVDAVETFNIARSNPVPTVNG